MPEGDQLHVRPLTPPDHDAWARLFAGYRDFYHLPADDQVTHRVWSWALDPDHETHCMLAEDDTTLVGLAHYRAFARPASGTTGLWLDDLYTDPGHRRRGVAHALLTQLRHLARNDGRSVIRWITTPDNHTAHTLYDTLAQRTTWITYDATP